MPGTGCTATTGGENKAPGDAADRLKTTRAFPRERAGTRNLASRPGVARDTSCAAGRAGTGGSRYPPLWPELGGLRLVGADMLVRWARPAHRDRFGQQ
jgi:hypothetical protein